MQHAQKWTHIRCGRKVEGKPGKFEVRVPGAAQSEVAREIHYSNAPQTIQAPPALTV